MLSAKTREMLDEVKQVIDDEAEREMRTVKEEDVVNLPPC